jgi:hypothetical protein
MALSDLLLQAFLKSNGTSDSFRGCRAWRPPPIQISIRPEEAVEYEKVPISRSRRQGASMETAVASSSEGVGGGQVPHTQAGSTSTAPSRDVTFEEKGAAKVAPIEAAVPPMEEVHKLNFVGKMTQLTGECSKGGTLPICASGD